MKRIALAFALLVSPLVFLLATEALGASSITATSPAAAASSPTAGADSGIVVESGPVLYCSPASATLPGCVITPSGSGVTSTAGSLACDTATASLKGCVSTSNQTFAGDKSFTGRTYLDGGAEMPAGQTLWLNSPTNTIGVRNNSGTFTLVGTGISIPNSSSLTGGANLTLFGGTADSSGIIGTTNTGSNMYFVSTIGATAATASVAAFHLRHTNGALASLDLEFLSEDSAGTDLVKWDETGLATVRQGVALGTTLVTFSAAAPTISSGFGTSPSVTGGNTAAFRINVGTGGSATSGVIGLPTATTGWNCMATDFTTPATGHQIKQTGGSTSTATISNYNNAGTLTAWTASDILVVMCAAY